MRETQQTGAENLGSCFNQEIKFRNCGLREYNFLRTGGYSSWSGKFGRLTRICPTFSRFPRRVVQLWLTNKIRQSALYWLEILLASISFILS